MPSPLGERQTDTPIAQANRGEVSRNQSEKGIYEAYKGVLR